MLLFPGTKDRGVILTSPTHMWLQVRGHKIFLSPSFWAKDFLASLLLQAQDSAFHSGTDPCSSAAPTPP